MVAVSLSGLLGPDDLQNDRQYLARIRQPGTKYLLTVLSDHTLSSDIFENLHTDKLCEVRLLAIDKAYSFDRVASKLLEMTERMAQENDISVSLDRYFILDKWIYFNFTHLLQVMKADFVNKRMKRILRSRNYKVLRDTVYTPNNTVDNKPQHPVNLSLFYKTLQQRQNWFAKIYSIKYYQTQKTIIVLN